jgi:hypothetical protein
MTMDFDMRNMYRLYFDDYADFECKPSAHGFVFKCKGSNM